MHLRRGMAVQADSWRFKVLCRSILVNCCFVTQRVLPRCFEFLYKWWIVENKHVQLNRMSRWIVKPFIERFLPAYFLIV